MTSNGSTPRHDAVSPAAPVPAAPLRVVPPETRLSALARLWARVVARSSFVPQGRATARAVLEDALRTIVAALTEEPFDSTVGREIGRTLVASHISSPKALGDSIDLLGGRLLDELGIADERAPRRLAALLGQIATGYTESLRDAALLAAEDINRAERTAWRDQQRKLHRRLQHALLHDRLTDLPNRAQFTGWLAETLARAPADARLGLCLVNLDRFKAINDSIGMEKADQVLLAVANRLSAQAGRYGHFLAHLGADTFAIGVARTHDSDDMAKVADRALRTLADPIRLDGMQIPITASAGIVERAVAGAQVTELVRAADISVGWAKADQGRYRQVGRWALFDENRNAVEVRRHTLTAEIPGALARGEFTLEYQPLVRLADRELVGVEALARWDHPRLGRIGPGQFIPSAEDTGLIVPLGLSLLEKACAQAAAWRSATGHELVMSVNLAVAQIRTPGLLAAITAVLRRTGWPAELLQLELTESALIGTDDDAMDIVHGLADLGIALAIDDFGTGYSSLAYLSELPVQNLKLAASFLRGLDTQTPTARSNLTILPALIKLSHDLDVTVTAEGIEAVDQADHLNGLGCDFGQGYLLGRPMPAADINDLLA
ncbi:MAG TPA: bifunctional diguanylate cyclase/phosphodiesterase [Pseudonocardiaceae bacterium]|nr:bifunctional diguanylate cyclase/phosphodiesterase [Pseudonocardiaceae bacterium]